MAAGLLPGEEEQLGSLLRWPGQPLRWLVGRVVNVIVLEGMEVRREDVCRGLHRAQGYVPVSRCALHKVMVQRGQQHGEHQAQEKHKAC